ASSCPDDHYLRAARPITVSAEEGAAESAAAALISGGGCFEQEESAAAAATLTSAVTSDRGEDDQAPLDPTAAVGVPAANSDARALSQVPHFDTFLSENGVADLNSDEDALQAGDCGDDNSANNSVPVAPSAEHTYSDIGASSYDDHGSIKLFESVTFDREPPPPPPRLCELDGTPPASTSPSHVAMATADPAGDVAASLLPDVRGLCQEVAGVCGDVCEACGVRVRSGWPTPCASERCAEPAPAACGCASPGRLMGRDWIAMRLDCLTHLSQVSFAN
uniref:Rab-GAP TBC domain-containing protein n=1 Tax=Macrostomum lignano TaxID=282301 RepID=A0A1I8FSL5_9PLAT